MCGCARRSTPKQYSQAAREPAEPTQLIYYCDVPRTLDCWLHKEGSIAVRLTLEDKKLLSQSFQGLRDVDRSERT